MFVDADDPVKFSLLTLTNDGDAARTLSVFAYNEWVLGPPRDGQRCTSSRARRRRAARSSRSNAYNPEFAARVAFAHASETPRSATGDRAVVHRPQRLAAPRRRRCGTLTLRAAFGAGLDPCAALHVQVACSQASAAGSLFLLGQGTDTRSRRAS